MNHAKLNQKRQEMIEALGIALQEAHPEMGEIFEDVQADEKYLNNQLDKINRLASFNLPEKAPTPAQDSPQPIAAKHYVYGDKVRVVFDEYEAGEYDTIFKLTDEGYILSTFDGTEIKSAYSADELEPYTESEAAPKPAPKFKEGDKVRILIEGELDNYPDGTFDTITQVVEHNGKFLYALCYWDDKPEHEHQAHWEASELEPYTQSEADKPKSLDYLNTESTTLYAVPKALHRFLTRNNEAMATFYMNENTVVIFPRSWLENRDAIMEAAETNTAIRISGKLDMSKDEPQYIFQQIEKA